MMEDNHTPLASATSRAENYKAKAANWEARAAEVRDPFVRLQFLGLAELWRRLSLFAGQHER
jgi:hypothetical protein